MGEPVFRKNFSSVEDMKEQFQISDANLIGVKIIFAWYGYGSYDGTAFVLFRKDKKLYEVNASHCSCYGLEGQWSPEETTKEALLARIKNGSLGRDSYTDGGMFADELTAILKRLR